MGDWEKAYEHKMIWNKIQLDLNTEESRPKIAHLKIKYEVEQKESELQDQLRDLALKEKEIQLNKVDIKLKENQLELKEKRIALLKSDNENQTIVRNSFIAGFVAILIISYIIYNGYRLKKRANRALENQNVEIQSKNEELSHLNSELETALKEVKQLSGLLPICSHCKKICDEEGSWKQMEVYIDEHSEARFSHGICPECIDMKFPHLNEQASSPPPTSA